MSARDPEQGTAKMPRGATAKPTVETARRAPATALAGQSSTSRSATALEPPAEGSGVAVELRPEAGGAKVGARDKHTSYPGLMLLK